MIPLRDDNPTRRFPLVTILIIVACVWVYFGIQDGGSELTVTATPDAQAQQQLEQIKFNFENAAIPDEVVEGEPLTVREVASALGAPEAAVAARVCEPVPRSADDPCFADKSPWLAVLYSMFLHGGLFHLGGNMLFLWIFGNNIEDHFGMPRYIVFYLAAGVVACLAHVIIQPDSAVPMVGASGAIAGVMGAYLIWFPNAPIRALVFFFPVIITAKWLLGFWFVSQFFVNPNEGVAWMAHVGGFVFGAVVGLVVRANTGIRKAMWRSAYDDVPPAWDTTGRYWSS